MPREEKWLVDTDCGSPGWEPSKMVLQDGGTTWKKRGTMEARYTVNVSNSITALELMEPKDFPELTLASQGWIFWCLSHTLDEFALMKH